MSIHFFSFWTDWDPRQGCPEFNREQPFDPTEEKSSPMDERLAGKPK